MRRGVWLFPSAPAGRLVDAIVAADELGLDEVWVADEGVARSPVPLLAAAATRTSRVRLATGISSPVLRHPGALAADLATIDELSGGRAVLGLGVGGELSLAPFGLRAERPVALIRDAILTARAVLTGHGDDRLYDPPEHAMPRRDVPIWVGARGPQLVRTAARLADGLFLSGCTPDEHDAIVAAACEVAGVERPARALYQTVVDRPIAPTDRSWAEVTDVLRTEAARLAPTAIGLNLLEVGQHDPVDLVARAADVLGAI